MKLLRIRETAKVVSFPFLSLSLIMGAPLANAARCDRPLPPDKTEMARDFSLSCSVGASYYVRQAEDFDYKEWRRLEGYDTLEGYEEAQDFRQKTPEPQWKGILNYATVESWTYDTWENLPSPHCPKEQRVIGYDKVDDPNGPFEEEVDAYHKGLKDGTLLAKNGFVKGGSSKPSGGSSSPKPSGGGSRPSGGGGTGLRIGTKTGDTVGKSKVGGGSGYFDTTGKGPSYIPKVKKPEPPASSSGSSSDYRYKGSNSGDDEVPFVAPPPKPRRIRKYRKEPRYGWVTIPCPTRVPKRVTRNCSQEILPFTAKFVRPSKAEWSKSTNKSYLNILPNKYDLLPDESESIRIVNSTGEGASMRPELSFLKDKQGRDQQYNDYRIEYKVDGQALRDPMPCVQHATASLEVNIHTIKRRTGSKPPNSLKEPLDEYGRKIPWFQYRTGINKSSEVVKTRPEVMSLVSSAEESIRALNREAMSGVEANASDDAPDNVQIQKSSGPNIEWLKDFWGKSTLRIRVIEPQLLGRDVLTTQPLILKNSSFLKEVGHYSIKLVGENNLYKRPSPPRFKALASLLPFSSDFDLVPEAKYLFLVSMKHNIPFYKNDCTDDMDDSCYSEDLRLEFQSSDIDSRSVSNKLFDFLSRP